MFDRTAEHVERRSVPTGEAMSATETRWTWNTAVHGLGKLAEVESPEG